VPKWLARKTKMPGYLAASVQGGQLQYAHGAPFGDASARIDLYGARALPSDKGLQKLAGEMHLERYTCSTLLRPGEYQVFLVEAPNVPKPELKSAMRWRVKDMIDYHVDDATIDVLDIPPDEAAGSRGHYMYAVCARNDAVQACIKTFQDAHIPLSVIDIQETAQRNVAALFEEPGRGLAVVYFGEDWGLLTINYRGELYQVRRLEIGTRQLLAADADARREARERVSLELQRTFDHFDRQFHHIALAQLLVAPLADEGGLVAYLAENVTVPVRAMELQARLAFDGAPPDPATQWRLFHHFGAALRQETKAP